MLTEFLTMMNEFLIVKSFSSESPHSYLKNHKYNDWMQEGSK